MRGANSVAEFAGETDAVSLARGSVSESHSEFASNSAGVTVEYFYQEERRNGETT